mmetsp:Transcript_28559/g.20641  ORF Transcript_28559/g.20641 Transcript_28559/m.20641 type:complete len:83 (+) Transcript_28559:162-410(+)
MLRYTEYCQKVNQVPQWSNVYNRVNITIKNEEFNAISRSQLDVAKHLDIIEKVRLEAPDRELEAFEHVMDIAQIDSTSAVND